MLSGFGLICPSKELGSHMGDLTILPQGLAQMTCIEFCESFFGLATKKGEIKQSTFYENL